VSRGFLLIGASLFERIGRWDGRRFYVDVGAGSYNWGVFYASVYWCALSVPEWCSAGRYWGGGMWSSAVYKGGLFMGYNNGGRGTVLAIRAVCLSLERLIRF
jgi:hypothetical protein